MRRRIFFIIQVFTILTLLFTVACTGKSETLPATPTSIPTLTPSPTPVNPPKAITVKNQQGFPLTLRSVFQEGDNIKAVFCFLLPTSEDWQLGHNLGDVVIFAGDQSSSGTRGGLVRYGGKKGSKQCLYTLFPAPGWQDVSEVKIIISRIATSMPEVPDCQMAQERLNWKLIPITIACKPGDHSFHWEISKKPADMPMEKALEIAYDEGLVDTILGPWTFITPFFASSAE